MSAIVFLTYSQFLGNPLIAFPCLQEDFYWFYFIGRIFIHTSKERYQAVIKLPEQATKR